MENFKINKLEVTQRKDVFYHSLVFFLFVLFFWLLYARNTLKDFHSVLQLLLYTLTYVSVLLFNIHYLFKVLFVKKKYFLFCLLTFLSFLLANFFQRMIYIGTMKDTVDLYFNGGFRLFLDILINTFTFIMFGAVGHFMILWRKWNKAQKRLSELENLNLQMELQNLKNQVSPHFLFNTLNNLYILSKILPEKASESILHLSDVLRYQLNSAKREQSTIIDELNYIKSIIHLEEIRRDNLLVEYQVDIDEPLTRIHPLILSPLVENAIKHGSQKVKNCRISIELSVRNQRIEFIIRNSIENEIKIDISDSSFLKNFKRTLELRYDNNYQFNCKIENNNFVSHLIIKQQ